MGLIESVKKAIENIIPGRRLHFGVTGLNQLIAPPQWGDQDTLRAYGDTGWLFRGASIIAHSVAQAPWRLYKVTQDGEREEITNHPIVDLFSSVNPYQTRFEFFYLQTLYMVLTGECFNVLEFNRIKVPVEIWSVPPHTMTIKRDKPEDYISFYEYRAGGQPVRLEPESVIHVKNPYPFNPMRGIGAGQALGVDLSIEKYSALYQARLFFNDAMPGLILEYPDTPPKEERDKLRESWKEGHEGWWNARKTAFLFGGAKANAITMTNRDLDFWRSAGARGDKILQVLGVPKIIAGIPEGTNRATAEVAKYIFAEYTILPILTQFREAFNEQLLPLYKKGANFALEIDFDNPVPENREQIAIENDLGIRGGYVTVNEARVRAGLEGIEGGDIFIRPITSLEVPVSQSKSIAVLGKPRTKFIDSIESREAFWKVYAAKTEAQEKQIIITLHKLWGDQEVEALRNLTTASSPNASLFDQGRAEREFNRALLPLMRNVMVQAAEDAACLINPEPAHRAITLPRGRVKQEFPLSGDALIWLMDRSALLVKGINDVTREALRIVLVDGFAEGQSIGEMAKGIRAVFDDCSRRRSIVIARTEVIAASNQGALEGYWASGVVEKVEFYTAMDERTCDDCLSLHEKQFIKGEAEDKIPVHPQCRCVWLPIVD